MDVRVGRPVYGGGFDAGEAGVVPFVLPGELLAAGGVEEASAARRVPECVHFGACGGCQYQHAEYGAQVQIKEEILRGLLGSAGIFAGDLATRTGPEWGYRNRIRLRVGEVEGELRVGYSRRGTNEFLPIVMCPIAAPVLWRAAEAMLQAGAEDAAGRRWMRSVSEVEIFCRGDESRVQVLFFLRDTGATASFAGFCERLRTALPELVGAGAEADPELGRRVRRGFSELRWGAAGMQYAAAGRDYWVGRGAFFQVNRFLVDDLVGLVGEGAGGGLAWDLYAGVGLFTRELAGRFGRVVAVEGGEQAAADLQAASRAGAAFEARRADTVEFLRAELRQRERPDLVVLDPPRAGLGTEGAALLAKVGAGRVVYVSCDPVTLARDLAVLVAGGCGVERVTLVDLFPQTFHLETVVHLRKL